MNTINHDNLSEPAAANLKTFLEARGNILSADHHDALRGLLRHMTNMATGKEQGRYAVGLDTGMGKTSAIAVWLAALVKAPGGDEISVSVAAQRVESLCELKRILMELGVPEDLIGLVHSYKHWEGDGEIPEGHASEPATTVPGHKDRFISRPIALVSHNRVRGTKGDRDREELFSMHAGRPRDLMVFDESLMLAEARHVSLKMVKAAQALVQVDAEDNPEIVLLNRWLLTVKNLLDTAVSSMDADTPHTLLNLPELSAGAEMGIPKLSPIVTPLHRDAIKGLVELAAYDLRLSVTGESSLLQFEVVVPQSLQNILILDASYPIRELMQLGEGIRDAETPMVSDGMALSTPLANLKDYSQVTWHIMNGPGGRSGMTPAFRSREQAVQQDVLDVVKAIPEDESVLLFVYKARKWSEGVDFKGVLLDFLGQNGIDTEATVPVPAPGNPGETIQRPRINVSTWGNETGSNAWTHCKHAILVGILQQDRQRVEALMCGQQNDMDAVVTQDQVTAVLDSETAHVAHQAASRTALRHVVNGKAGEAHIWAIHPRPDELKAYISKVQCHAVWTEWEGRHSTAKRNQRTQLAEKLVAYLEALPDDVHKLSLRSLKKGLEWQDIPASSFQRARDKALEDGMEWDWKLDGQSLVRI